MKYSDTELRDLAGRATPLHQRWNGVPRTPASAAPETNARLERWRHVLSIEGDEAIFTRRLGLDGLALESCLAALGNASVSHDAPPAWAERLNGLLTSYSTANDDDGKAAGDPVAFADCD